MPASTTDPPPAVLASVLVPVLDEAAAIRASVAAMVAQALPHPGAVQILLADGGSTDGTREVLEAMAAEDPRILVLDNPLGGTASGLNVCLAAAEGTYVARMDAHTTYPPDYLARGIERLAAGDVTWVAGPQVPVGAGPVSRAVEASLATWLGRGASGKWAADGAETDLDTGVFCGVWRREHVLQHGGWDEGWPRNQDSEMAARFLRGGERIVNVPAMAARYQPRDTLRGLWRQYHEYGIYRARTALRHPTSLRRSAVLPPVLVLAAAAGVAAPAPRLLRRGGRLALAAYGAALTRAGGQAARGGAGPARLVPVVLATMHLAHGTGFLRGAGRWGVPGRALLRLAGLRRPEDEGPYRGPVDAPSLAQGRR